jgi:site-specific recombinase XerD
MPLPTTTHTPPPAPRARKASPLDWTDAPSIFWSEVWDDLRLTDHRLAKVTHLGRLSILRHFANWIRDSEHDITDPGDVIPRHVKEYLADQEDARDGSGVLNVYKALRMFFRHYAGTVRGCEECGDRDLYRSHSCPKTPIHGVRRPKPSEHKSREMHVMTEDEWTAVLKAAGDGRTLKSARDRAMLMLLADSGLRRAELQALSVSDVDLAGQIVRVEHGKNDKKRLSVFSDDTVTALLAYLKVRTGLRLAGQVKKWADEHPDEPLWVSTKGGRQLSYIQTGKIMTDLGEAAGVDLHTHMTRHMAADRAYRQGMTQKDMMVLFGWSGRIPSTMPPQPTRSAPWPLALPCCATGKPRRKQPPGRTQGPPGGAPKRLGSG